MNSKVSIVLACYNDGSFIEKALKSALAQTIENKEIIIVDDGSNLKTKKVLKGLQPKVDKLITQENKGVSAARNRGIEVSSGDYILVLDSDDYFEPDFCKRALEAFNSKENLCLVTSYARWFDNKGPDQIHKPSGGTLKNFLFKNSAIGNSMFMKSDWKKVGGYDEAMLQGWEDWEFFIRLHKEGCATHVIPEVLFNYRKKKKSRTNIANQYKYDLWNYIVKKHSDLYKENFPETLDFFINKLKEEEAHRKKIEQKFDYKIGHFLLGPFRIFRKLYLNPHL